MQIMIIRVILSSYVSIYRSKIAKRLNELTQIFASPSVTRIPHVDVYVHEADFLSFLRMQMHKNERD